MAAFDTIVARATAHSSIFDYTNIIREIKTHKMEIKKGFYAMGKKLDLNKTVYDLVQEYPELVDILKELGFSEITKTAMLHSVGRMTTIPKGAKMKKISMMSVVSALMQNGFELVGTMPDLSAMNTETHEMKLAKSNETAQSNESAGNNETEESNGMADYDSAAQEPNTTELLKGYLKRLGQGEDLENVRKDFVQNFSEVEASEIMKAEQELIKEGTPITEVQKLCDVHSALFHGATREEKIANAEKAAMESLKKEQENETENRQTGTIKTTQAEKVVVSSGRPMPEAYRKKHEAAKALRETVGHPLYTLTKENEKIAALIENIRNAMEAGEDVGEKMKVLRQLAIHYAKKGDLLYPLMKVRYEISGPSDVMWTVDDEIRDELAALDKNNNHDEEWRERVDAVLKRADEMIYKEDNILFPICAVNFSEEEWYGIYEDAKDYALVFEVEETWEEAEDAIKVKKEREQTAIREGEVVMAGGHMTVAQLESLLNTLPIEISFVDADNINRYFNEGPKVFKRPQMAIDREVFSCHPPKIEPMVRNILESFRNNERDSVPVWMEKGGKPFLVTYMAVRDKRGNYLGTVEVVQDMQFAKEHFEK